MADSIKGITVEIGGDTVGLQSALADVNATSRNLYSELRQVDRLLQFDPGNVELLAQRENVLNQQIETTQEKLTRLRSVYAQVEAQAQRGDIGAEQFRRFQREVITTEQRLQRFQQDMHETEQVAEREGGKIGDSLKSALGAAVAGKGLSEVVSSALESTNLDTKISVAFDVPAESQAAVKNAIGTINAYGVDAETSLAGVRKQWQLNGNLTDAQNTKIAQSAGAIAAAYDDIDFTELIQESNEMARTMGMSQEQALGMTNTLLKMGFPPDQLDIITEYGGQLQRAGFDATQIQGIFAAGIKTGSWNIDNLLDGLKEGRVQMAGFGAGVDKATAGLLKTAGIGKDQFTQWGKAIAGGGKAGQDAMLQVGKALSGVKDATTRNQLGVKIFGTMWEDNGSKITDALAGATTQAGNLEKNTKGLADTTNKINSDPTVKLHQAMSDLSTALQPVYDVIAKVVGKLADWVTNNPTLAATITAVAVGVGILLGVMAALAPILTAIVGVAGLLELELAAIALPVLAVVAVIAALIAIGVLLYKNWDKIKEKAAADWKELVSGVKAMGGKIKEHFNKAVDDIKSIWGKVTKFFSGIDLSKVGADIMNGLKNGIASAAQKIYDKATEIANKVISKIKNAFKSKSPSKVTHEIGLDVGAGLELGLRDSMGNLSNSAIDMANNVINSLDGMFNDKDNVVTGYFEAIQEDGDYLNDMLVHMPRKVKQLAQAWGTILAPNLEGTRKQDFNKDWDGNNRGIYVSIQSPKALDERETAKQLNRTINSITNMW